MIARGGQSKQDARLPEACLSRTLVLDGWVMAFRGGERALWRTETDDTDSISRQTA